MHRFFCGVLISDEKEIGCLSRTGLPLNKFESSNSFIIALSYKFVISYIIILKNVIKIIISTTVNFQINAKSYKQRNPDHQARR
jgi:hypothetical protein